MQSIFGYFEPFRRDSQVCQTDGQTDRDSFIAYAVLHYIAWLEKDSNKREIKLHMDQNSGVNKTRYVVLNDYDVTLMWP